MVSKLYLHSFNQLEDFHHWPLKKLLSLICIGCNVISFCDQEGLQVISLYVFYICYKVCSFLVVWGQSHCSNILYKLNIILIIFTVALQLWEIGSDNNLYSKINLFNWEFIRLGFVQPYLLEYDNILKWNTLYFVWVVCTYIAQSLFLLFCFYVTGWEKWATKD